MKYILSFIILMYSFACSTLPKNNTTPTIDEKPKEITLDFSRGEPTIVYKTIGDYYNKIPILLSDDKTRIVHYPHPKDVFYRGNLALPTKLNKGYFLDNRGIGINTVFLNITYEEYAQLEVAPKITDMEKMIINKNPIIELCDCGNRNQFEDDKKNLNQIIDNNQLNKCKKIK